MTQEVFTETQRRAAKALCAKLFENWIAENDAGTKLLAVSLFVASAVASTAPDRLNAENVIRTIARQASLNIDNIPGWPGSRHGKP